MGREGWSPSCTCFQHTDSTGSPCCCFLISWLFSCYLPHKQVSTARELSLSHCRCASTLVQQYFSADPCTFPFPHLPSRLGNWANWKPMSECVLVGCVYWIEGILKNKRLAEGNISQSERINTKCKTLILCKCKDPSNLTWQFPFKT